MAMDGSLGQPSEINAYSQYYPDCVSTRVKDAWQHIKDDYKDHIRQELTEDDEPAPNFINTHVQVLREMLDAEPGDFRSHLKELIDHDHKAAMVQFHLGKETPVNRTPEDYQKFIQAAQYVLIPWFKWLCEGMGLKGAMILRGPLPMKGGEIGVFSIHEGLTRGAFPVNWPQLDNLGYAQVEQCIYRFLLKAHTEEDCWLWALQGSFSSDLTVALGTGSAETGGSVDTQPANSSGDNAMLIASAEMIPPTATPPSASGTAHLHLDAPATPSAMPTAPTATLTLPPATAAATPAAPAVSTMHSVAAVTTTATATASTTAPSATNLSETTPPPALQAAAAMTMTPTSPAATTVSTSAPSATNLSETTLSPASPVTTPPASPMMTDVIPIETMPISLPVGVAASTTPTTKTRLQVLLAQNDQSSWPRWLSETIDFGQSTGGSGTWAACLCALVDLEEKHGFKDDGGSVPLPEQHALAAPFCWKKYARSFSATNAIWRTVPDVSEEVSRFKWWWGTMLHVVKETSPTIDWTVLAQVGKNGVVCVVISLIWWSCCIDKHELDREDWTRAVTEVTATFYLIRDLVAVSGLQKWKGKLKKEGMELVKEVSEKAKGRKSSKRAGLPAPEESAAKVSRKRARPN
ncbi:hypothetical protein OE88DRAFT_1734151 [Heliocybe sulcata]|uniref:Uncharacterized protein n=1 Tax=Heliocybe sulcata TaxID=5364 RepID=A0A5C3N7E0_9AGAM|nr:hypothetical protein OE88DRAFT_1734151 [Heliocybe sulcata]